MYMSTGDKKFMRPGHHWLFKFGDAGDGTSCEKKFILTRPVGNITRVPGSTTASKLLWSNGGSTEWRKIPRVSLLRSGIRHKTFLLLKSGIRPRTQMPRSHQ